METPVKQELYDGSTPQDQGPVVVSTAQPKPIKFVRTPAGFKVFDMLIALQGHIGTATGGVTGLGPQEEPEGASWQ